MQWKVDLHYLKGSVRLNNRFLGISQRSGQALNIILNAEELLKHMTSAEKADLHDVLPFIADVLAQKEALVGVDYRSNGKLHLISCKSLCISVSDVASTSIVAL